MKKLELYLKYMNSIKKAVHSIDVYFNNLEPEFVVKIIDNIDNSNNKHFRNIKLKTAIKEACEYLESQSN